MKKTPIIIAIAAVAVILSACTPSVTVQQPAEGTMSGISVSGEGEVTGTPDTLTMSFGVSVTKDSVSEAVAVAADEADAVMAALMSNGVAEEDIQTSNYSIWPQYDYTGQRQILVGYQVNNNVTVKIRDIETAGATIDAVAAAGGDDVTVNGVAFSIEDNEALITAARDAAFADAKAKAEQLAELSGVTLGDPISISENFSPAPQPYRYDEVVFAGADSAETSISPGEQSVVVSVAVQFSISN
jgi:uncharacterized protein